MEPKALISQDWSNISTLVSLLWTFLVAIVIFGGAFLTAHAFLPALASGEALRKLKGLRLFLYSVSGITFVVAVFLAAQTLGWAPSVIHFYPKFWM